MCRRASTTNHAQSNTQSELGAVDHESSIGRDAIQPVGVLRRVESTAQLLQDGAQAIQLADGTGDVSEVALGGVARWHLIAKVLQDAGEVFGAFDQARELS